MKKILYVILGMLIISGCSSGSSNNDSNTKETPEVVIENDTSELAMTYYHKNGLMGKESTIHILEGTLYLEHKSYFNPVNKFLRDYEISQADQIDMLKFLESVKFNKMKSPPKDDVLDASEIYLTASYYQHINKLDLGAVEFIPEDIQRVREKLFDLVRKYDSGFINESLIN